MSLNGSQQEPPDDAGPSPAVVAWGGDGDDGDGPGAGRRSVLGGVARDRRLVPLAVGLGALAVLLSLMSEWQVTVVQLDDGGGSDRPLPARLDDLTGWASGYLVGLFMLAAATVLLLSGPPAVRRPARLVALSTGGLLLALLAAVVSDLRGRSQLNNLLELTLDDDQVTVTYGRGVWCAVVGVAAVTLGAQLAGRHLPAAVPPGLPVPAPDIGAADADTADTDTGAGGTGAAAEPATDFSWRRPPGGAPYDDEPPEAPLGLTVEPTAPFTRRIDDRDLPG